jgi:calcineurin-like phosphoesterase family protein
MSRVFYSSDEHHLHDLVSEERGFASVEEHTEWLIDRHNSVVNKRDTVFFLGDFTLKHPEAVKHITDRLLGRKHLILGNHDKAHPSMRRAHMKVRPYLDLFQSVQLHGWTELPGTPGRRVLLSHLPYDGDHKDRDRLTQWRLRDEGLWLLCGHVHTAWKVRGNQINVGVDQWPDGPVLADDLGTLIRETEEGRASTP